MKRMIAISWWNSQTEEYKISQFKEYKKSKFTPSISYKTLTGREIELIYNDLKLSEKALKTN